MNPDPNHESPGGDEFDALLLKLSLGDLTEDERARLEDGVRGDEALRQRYLEYIEIDAMLRWRANGKTALNAAEAAAAAEAEAEAEAGSGRVPAPKPDGRRRRAGGRGRIAWIGAGIAAAAACAMIGFLDWGRDGGTDPVVAGGGAPEGAALAQAQSHPVERAMAKVQRAGDWLIRADADADFAVAGDGALNLVRGALYAERASGALADADAGSDTLTISTPAGTVTSCAGRFHLETLPIENQEPDPNMDTNANAKPNALTRLFVIAGSAILANAGAEAQTDPGEIAAAEQGQTPQKLQADGNYAEALAIYEKLLADRGHGGKAAADDLQSAFQCLNQLARYSAIDPLLEDAAKVHADDWRVLWRAATLYQNAPHYGSMIENEFARADQDQRGRRIDMSERDRIRALQLMAAAMPLAQRVIGEDGAAVADFYADLGGLVTGGRQVWNWQYLTDFSKLPEYGDPTYWSSNGAPPVDEEGNAKFYEVPESWAAAANDGERWRWTLEQQKKADPTRALRVDYAYAYHLWQLFGVHTAGALGTPLLEDGEIMPEGRYTAHTLTKQETIARLATGVQRFALPAGHNFIERFEAVASAPLEEAPNPLRNLRFKLYEGDWDKLPDFAKLEPKAEGEVPSGTFDLELTDRREHFGFVFEGEIEIGEAGEFKFQIWSDDGSRLTIGDFVVDNDGLHGSGQSNTGTVKLEAGTHKIRAEFFEKNGEETFIAQCWGPGMEEGAYLSRMRHGTLPQEDALTQLAQLHENRQQFENAADYWRRSIAQFGAAELLEARPARADHAAVGAHGVGAPLHERRPGRSAGHVPQRDADRLHRDGGRLRGVDRRSEGVSEERPGAGQRSAGAVRQPRRAIARRRRSQVSEGGEGRVVREGRSRAGPLEPADRGESAAAGDGRVLDQGAGDGRQRDLPARLGGGHRHRLQKR
ncbi:MAG: PA14 domain-containing protein [Verrucomicrobiales bacterium]